MAVVVVNKAQTGSTSTATLTITKPTAGNWLIAFVNQVGTTAAPTGKDNTGSGGWSLLTETHSLQGASANSMYAVWKKATGSEEKLNPTAGAGGAVQGISYVEVSGLGESPTLEQVAHADNLAAGTALSLGPLVTTDATDLLLACVELAAASGTISAWTGTVLNNVETATTRNAGGYLVPGETLNATPTAHWETSRTNGGLFVVIKPSGGSSPVTIPLNAAASTSSASAAVTAPTTVPVAAAASSSGATAAVTAATRVPLSAAASASSASAAVTAATIVPLSSALSLSAASTALSATTTIPLAPAASTSATSSPAITAATTIPLASASSSSSASIPTISASTTVPLDPALSNSAGQAALSAATLVPLEPASSTSSATCTITIGPHGASASGLAGRVNPRSRAGRVTPVSLAGRVNPRPGNAT